MLDNSAQCKRSQETNGSGKFLQLQSSINFIVGIY